MSDFVSYSQAGQDIFVYEQLVKPTNFVSGTFLDIGCGFPSQINNTFALEELGWRGLLVDMDHERVEMCKRERKNPVIEHDATTLDYAAACDAQGLGRAIDYLSLDIDDQPGEDSKALKVLKNLFAAGFSFRVITCEHDRYRLGDTGRNAMRELLLANSYTLAKADHTHHDLEFEDWWTK
jgi:hypothetical protein